ncbi:1-deoxy-D-xylulose 5-phosphate reductoisomerase [Treponema maltophilum ATCC 51939]|uniref:1-deoxy-D-xylulose 5-phosphate reductoisomerase n=1 Tax=Treponema maltophilum ATCC 51939 TaxID=1125699 RepID=S3L1Z1_TREMA|nr:1-deoxy-D-xylulose-5-phosphate reductoisomerase [Treponema maltophilum]EPF30809.1 1-deoxy-D-xylulose 5-phosphate reductoisomerase [Treponema maltophilum ATCC 51939]
MKKKILVLGCTGSIGSSALDIVRRFPDLFSVCGLTAHTRKTELEKLCREFSCTNAATAVTEDSPDEIRCVIEKSNADIAVNGIAGSAGLMPSVWCLQNNINLALANKETVVMAGPLIKELASAKGRSVIPVDSEHSALFFLIERFGKERVSSLILTASGGPFRTLSADKLASVTLEDALKHPTWNMGKKISIDSATLANKGLEVIEACRLFDMPPEKVKVAVHPQSLVHSLIQTVDGDLYAQISEPDMRRPILSALTWPEVIENDLKKLDLTSAVGDEGICMNFFPPRFKDFPLLGCAYEAQKAGGAYTIAYNAANEVAVEFFLQRKIGFTAIQNTVTAVLDKDWSQEPENFEAVFALDTKARKAALAFVTDFSGRG